MVEQAWVGHADYGTKITGHDIDTAVLDHGLVNADEFAIWVARSADQNGVVSFNRHQNHL